ncbi:phospholipase A2 inhibitor and Ly6/PLAUR domain-containing protein-like [Podarcis raffonei]|uniref:phospholipase A2 inhibitor and Ly6/PLAUR domain-containing protein-like n=1 Tax=Podarcis raffonei TaxID=65483 RepID=UPI002329480F|nr:phospholipase A2 inhibitor and Ly6/PLAUR domain-containing protein-like [Podarcis raffonei]
MKALLSTCLLLPLLSSALPLHCRYASNRTGLTYDGYVENTCNLDDDSCASSVLRTNLVKFQGQLLNQCSRSSICYPGHYSFTAANGEFFEMKMQCCKTELCNNEILSLPDRNMMAENGLQCRSCFSNGTTKCEGGMTINCLENETQCVDFQGSLNDVVNMKIEMAVQQQIFVPLRKKDLLSELGYISLRLSKKDAIMLHESHTSLKMKGEWDSVDLLLVYSKIHGNEEDWRPSGEIQD